MIQLDNTFRVPLPVDQTWRLLTDLPRVATCLPGAHLDAVVDGEYRGGLSTKIGPINARYSGVASFTEFDEISHRAVISARGKEEKGSGSAAATITASLLPDGDDGTNVQVSTSMAISGRAAQFGRSLLAEVSTTLLAEFVRRLEAMIQGGETDIAPVTDTASLSRSTSPATAPTSTSQAVGPIADGANPHEDTLDLATTIVLPLLRRSATPIAVALISCLVGVLIGRRQNRRLVHRLGAYRCDPTPMTRDRY